MTTTEFLPLAVAVERHVQPADAVHVILGHSRWTAAARELCRRRWGERPELTLIMASLSSLAALFFRRPVQVRRFTLGFTYFFAGLGYTLAGISKLVGTGVSWADGRHLWMWIYEKGVDALSKTGVADFNLLQELALADHTVATAFLAFGMLTELGAWLMWWRRFRTPVILAVLGLHLGIFWVMNIMFYLAFYELVLLGLPWAAWIDRARAVPAAGRVLGPVERFTMRFA